MDSAQPLSGLSGDMREFSRPRVVVSKCIGFAPCRYNGDMVSSSLVQALMHYVDFVPVCPEVEIGLGIPRDPVRIVRKGTEDHLVQPTTGRDFSDEMRDFAISFLSSLPEVDGFILKNRSPTSGIKDVKIYPDMDSPAPITRGAGFFGREVLRLFPDHPVEDEGRIRNHRIREHFLTCIFTLADFRRVAASRDLLDLVEYHTENKYLLMTHNQSLTRTMGRLIAHQQEVSRPELFRQYHILLRKALKRAPRYTAQINVLLHALGRFSDQLEPDEKAFFLDALGRYHSGTSTICLPKSILRSWIVRFHDEFLEKQTFFSPYPDKLTDISPSETDRGRDFWRNNST
jgi:uncharacterized protein YbgA (DUF1722 family)/uncharacterized protein YbbK (DUF523 family)